MSDRKYPGAAPAAVALIGFAVFCVLVFAGIYWLVSTFTN
jgi:hypothetical protein